MTRTPARFGSSSVAGTAIPPTPRSRLNAVAVPAAFAATTLAQENVMLKKVLGQQMGSFGVKN